MATTRNPRTAMQDYLNGSNQTMAGGLPQEAPGPATLGDPNAPPPSLGPPSMAMPPPSPMQAGGVSMQTPDAFAYQSSIPPAYNNTPTIGPATDPHRQAVAAAYQQYLGRAMSDQDYQSWAGNNNAAAEIANSPEARARGGGGSSAPQPGVSREQYRDAWMGSGAKSMDDLKRFVAQYGGQIISDNGTVRTPYGFDIDMLIGAKGAAAGGSAASAGWTSLGGGGGGAAPGAGGAPAGGDGNDFTSQVRKMLMDQLTKLSAPVTAEDPTIANEMQAQSRVAERGRQDRRSASAERAAMQGYLSGGASSGAFDADVASGYQDKTQGLQDLQGQLFTREITARRGQLSQMLQLAVQTGDAESTRALQLKIAEMDAALRRAGLSESARQHDDSFGLDAAKYKYGQDRDLALYGFGAN